jgi:hypothetical protein
MNDFLGIAKPTKAIFVDFVGFASPSEYAFRGIFVSSAHISLGKLAER